MLTHRRFAKASAIDLMNSTMSADQPKKPLLKCIWIMEDGERPPRRGCRWPETLLPQSNATLIT
jgi:hypothetical protein